MPEIATGQGVRLHALRMLAEGAHATIELLALASGRSEAGLQRLAARGGWKLVEAGPLDVSVRIRKAAGMVLGKVEELGKAAETGAAIDKSAIDGLIAMIRGLEKIGEIMRPEEAAQENQIRDNENLAETLRRIEERIVELAGELAARMVEEKSAAASRTKSCS
ncbi:hypothetical protein ACFPLB_05090 [Aquamicrobium segne]|uniref:Transcriptional regulator n=1 Tax=Aquamicrobium segne TaxID=469547 RepID=A0ABW0GUK9_9HYPH